MNGHSFAYCNLAILLQQTISLVTADDLLCCDWLDR